MPAGPRRSPSPTASRSGWAARGSRSSARTSFIPGAHKLNNALGQILLAKRMGKKRVVAETGAGQHGVATAAAAAKLGVACRVYMGVTDMARQAPNVSRMRLLGAEVVGVDSGSKTLKDAINEAMRDWTENVATTHYVLGSALGPHPYPTMVREFQAVIGREARAPVSQARAAAIRMPRRLRRRRLERDRALFGVPRSRLALRALRAPSCTASRREDADRGPAIMPRVFREDRSVSCTARARCFSRTSAGQTLATHSVSAGLDYPAVGPEHAGLHDAGRVTYTSVSDGEALEAFGLLCETRGHPSRPGVRPCDRVRRGPRPQMAARPLDSGQPLRSGRQGPRRGPAVARRGQ